MQAILFMCLEIILQTLLKLMKLNPRRKIQTSNLITKIENHPESMMNENPDVKLLNKWYEKIQ